ncbi:Hypothetical predicted protein [Lecanosticta acicola]|uniref:Uncharacterized protein n=1 Tax=Lecanosticta acicola TaxID=111012 RepID=A0AAI8YU61_9PEZI|nr:Hypothetical predicted protein [Lecanosticta acicola]
MAAESTAEAFMRLDRQLAEEEEELQRIKDFAAATAEAAEQARIYAARTNDVVGKNRKSIGQRKRRLVELEDARDARKVAEFQRLLNPLGELLYACAQYLNQHEYTELETLDSTAGRTRKATSTVAASSMSYPNGRLSPARNVGGGAARAMKGQKALPAVVNNGTGNGEDEDVEEEVQVGPPKKRRRKISLSTHSEIVVALGPTRPSPERETTSKRKDTISTEQLPRIPEAPLSSASVAEAQVQAANTERTQPRADESQQAQIKSAQATVSQLGIIGATSPQPNIIPPDPIPARSMATSSSGLFVREQWVRKSQSDSEKSLFEDTRPVYVSGPRKVENKMAQVSEENIAASGEQTSPLRDSGYGRTPSNPMTAAPPPDAVVMADEPAAEDHSVDSSLFGEGKSVSLPAETGRSQEDAPMLMQGHSRQRHRRSRSSTGLFVSERSPTPSPHRQSGTNDSQSFMKGPASRQDTTSTSEKPARGRERKSRRKKVPGAQVNSMVSDALLEKYR